jgi:hypothetical protein
MKKIAFVFTIMLLCALGNLYAQQPQVPASTTEDKKSAQNDGANRLAAIISTPRSEWIGMFDKINIVGHMQVTLIRMADGDEPRIYFDTKGSTTTKFKAEIDKKGVLNIIETVDDKRTTTTEVKVYFKDISSLSVAGANVAIEGTFERQMFDVSVSGGATLQANVDILDMSMIVTGCSSVVIKGASRYLGLEVSTAKIDASALQTMSTIVDASHGAEVSLFVTERLEATTSTSAKVSYKGDPMLVRSHSALFGGAITPINK